MTGLFTRSGKLYELYASYLSIFFGRSVYGLVIKWILLSK